MEEKSTPEDVTMTETVENESQSPPVTNQMPSVRITRIVKYSRDELLQLRDIIRRRNRRILTDDTKDKIRELEIKKSASDATLTSSEPPSGAVLPLAPPRKKGASKTPEMRRRNVSPTKPSSSFRSRDDLTGSATAAEQAFLRSVQNVPEFAGIRIPESEKNVRFAEDVAGQGAFSSSPQKVSGFERYREARGGSAKRVRPRSVTFEDDASVTVHVANEPKRNRETGQTATTRPASTHQLNPAAPPFIARQSSLPSEPIMYRAVIDTTSATSAATPTPTQPPASHARVNAVTSSAAFNRSTARPHSFHESSAHAQNIAKKLTKQLSSSPDQQKPAYMADLDAVYNHFHPRIRRDFGSGGATNHPDAIKSDDGGGKRQLQVESESGAGTVYNAAVPLNQRAYKSARIGRSRSATEQQQKANVEQQSDYSQPRTAYAQQAGAGVGRAVRGRNRAVFASNTSNSNSNASGAVSGVLQPSSSDIVQKNQLMESFIKDSFASLSLTESKSASGASEISKRPPDPTQNNPWVNFKNVDPTFFVPSTANPVFSATLQSADVTSSAANAPMQSDSASTTTSNQALNNQKYKKRSRHIRRKQNQKMHNMRMNEQDALESIEQSEVPKQNEADREKGGKRKQPKAQVIEGMADVQNENERNSEKQDAAQEDDEQKKSGRQARAAMRRQRQKAKRRTVTAPSGDVTSGESGVSPEVTRKSTSDVTVLMQTIQL